MTLTSLPLSTVPDPREAPVLRWGILGTGWIAERFVAALQSRTGQVVSAVGSRASGTARAFADRFGIERAHGSYADLVADPEVDVVYVATPHTGHLPDATLAMQAGKHVLVEKPIGINAAQARELALVAERTGRYCAEAMWTFFLPKFDVLRQVLEAGAIGGIRSVVADMGEYFDDAHRILRPELAGGPMLDLGTYPVSFALSVLGVPDSVNAIGTPAPTGVNGQAGILLGHADTGISVIHTTLHSNTPTGATIAGTTGTITLPGFFYRPGPFRVDFYDGRDPWVYDEETYDYDGLAYEAAETARRIAAGDHETPLRPLAASIDTLQTMDQVRRQLGARFEGETW